MMTSLFQANMSEGLYIHRIKFGEIRHSRLGERRHNVKIKMAPCSQPEVVSDVISGHYVGGT